MLIYFIFVKLVSNYVVSLSKRKAGTSTIKITLIWPQVKTQNSSLNSTISSQTLKSKTQSTEGTVREGK